MRKFGNDFEFNASTLKHFQASISGYALYLLPARKKARLAGKRMPLLSGAEVVESSFKIKSK
jgi:hypothetical protein